MIGHNVKPVLWFPGHYKIMCECGKQFTPLIIDGKRGAYDAELIARRRHILHLEEVIMKMEYDERQSKLPKDPYAEFTL